MTPVHFHLFPNLTISKALWLTITGQHDGLLLGDSGYPCKTYLMTPYNNTNDVRHKERFNSALCRTRVVIEQTYGILKRRFPCLAAGLRTKPDRACQYVVACVILHNIGILRQDIVTISADDLLIAGPDVQEIDHANNNGFTYRDIIARQCFNQWTNHDCNISIKVKGQGHRRYICTN